LNIFVVIIQIGLLTVLFLLGNLITKYLHIPLPGSIVGLVLLFLLLQFKVVKIEWIEKGATWLLAELLLFFIPSAVGVVNYQQVISSQGVKLITVIVLSTLTVMAFTGLTAQFIAKRGKGELNESRAKHR
jgi:holin-like protein